MKILADQKLVNSVRKKSDKLEKRFWIAVPYIGNLSSVRKIIGNRWIENNRVDVRLITDTSSLTNFSSDSLTKILELGMVKNILGLHAKVYIIDDCAFVTSANLTNTAFSKRAEIGIYLNKSEAKELIKQYETWWNEGDLVSKLKIARKLKSKKTVSREDKSGFNLPNRNKLLEDPGSEEFHIPLRYLNYHNLVEAFDDFAQKYSKTVERVWPNSPIFTEVDCFLDYLYHHNGKTSNKYKSKKQKPRSLSYNEKITEIKKYFSEFKNFVNNDMLDRRTEGTKLANKYLSQQKINRLTLSNLKLVLDHINSLSTFAFHKKNTLNKNKISNLRGSLYTLLYSTESLPIRFIKCSTLKNFKESSIYEMLDLYYPDNYLLINNNSLSGLRFFGYDVWLK